MNDVTDPIEDEREEDNEPVSARKPPPMVDDEPEDAPEAPRREAKNSRELVLEELPARARRVQKLKSYLTGKIVIEIADKGERYLFDWTENEPKCVEVREILKLRSIDESGKEATGTDGVDCIVRLKEHQLMAIQAGDLNPQIAIVNEKVKIDGRPGLAMYLFNLVYPRHP